MKDKLAIAVLISGRGSNLQALIDAANHNDFPARISVVISNVPEVFGLERARKAGIPALVVNHKDFSTRAAFEDALMLALRPYSVDLICLAGFMRILTPHFIQHWPQRIVNIHPSLLPLYKGTDTHARALADGQREAGCTVHYVVPEVDSGALIVQARVPILPDDTPQTLADRVLAQEHILYPQAIAQIAPGLLKALEVRR
ncbi:MAG: phosphoribosylglycinamide formyltransferase [Alphaproteobacteria bacterium]|nr:phosphoribosylglycinamide formyltransferase [Alphaproteobacteria bacterium]